MSEKVTQPEEEPWKKAHRQEMRETMACVLLAGMAIGRSMQSLDVTSTHIETAVALADRLLERLSA